MKKKTIIILAVIISLVLSGLILIQLYWINNSIEAKNQQFRVYVNNALDAVVLDMEQQETIERIVEEIDMPLVDSVVAIVPSRSALARQLRGYRSESNIPLLEDHNDVIASLTISREGQKILFYSDDEFFYPEEEIPELSSQSLRAGINDRLTNKTVLLESIMGKILAETPELSERVDPERVNDQIDQMLGRLGISLDHEFAITSSGTPIYSSDGFDMGSDANKYIRQLFPNDPVPGQNMIYLYFPREKNYLFRQIGFMGISSIIVTLFLIVFTVSNILIILRQKRISEIRNDFINNMTHELKTPISTISLASQMIGDTSISNNKKNLDKIAGILNDESLRLKYQVEKVLQTSAFERGTMKLKMVDTDIHRIINNAIDNFRLQISDTGGMCLRELNAKESRLKIDETHVFNMISNLLDNAIKYSNGSPEIKIKTTDDEKQLTLSISDNGIGMKKDDIKKIFDKFYRVPTGNIHKVKGFGLGLSYVKKIVEEHNGSISVYSQINRGTRFNISFPKHN
ncbi:MAG: HAMP domain-containing sensor histidine kinase [Bacteroidales bacterium]|nr:HAMP domain-containing sensor histidine kinase [Bacteroidales bacterium]